MLDKLTFGIISRIFIAFFTAFFIHMLIVAVLGSFYDSRELQELLGGNSTLPVFIPTVIVCEVWVVARYLWKKLQDRKYPSSS